MQAHAVFQLDLLDFLRRIHIRLEMVAGGDGRLLDEAVRHCPRQRIIHDDIAERDLRLARFHKRRRRQLQTEQRLEFVNGAHSRLRAVAVRLIHQQHQIGQIRQMIEITVAQHLAHPLDTRFLAAAHLAVNLGDIKDIDTYLTPELATKHILLVVIVAGNHARRLLRKFGNALEDIFRCVRGEIGNQLVVNGQVGREDKEIVNAIAQMQIGNASAHQARLADPGRQGKTKRGKLALKIA